MEFTIWMTTSCNFKCKYCYVDKQNITMSSDTAHNVVDYICDVMKDKSDENINIIFHGGEPFYNYRQQQLVYIIQYVICISILTYLITNQ